jgi:hypothetical protein
VLSSITASGRNVQTAAVAVGVVARDEIADRLAGDELFEVHDGIMTGRTKELRWAS